jgi:short subunit dehydrogenase-like uncharacterized protein
MDKTYDIAIWGATGFVGKCPIAHKQRKIFIIILAAINNFQQQILHSNIV